LTYIDLGETSPDQRSPLWTFSEEERRLSLRDLWRRLVYPCSAPYTSVFQINASPMSDRSKIGRETPLTIGT
jgi:hypothetical protein